MILKWATSLVLALVMAGTAVAGVPLHFGGQGCGDMECCVTDMASVPSHHGETPAEQAANLYCFLNCPEPAAPLRAGASGKISPPAGADKHPAAAAQPPLVVPPPRPRLHAGEARRRDSHPAYIRHLALLI